jgi:ribosome biogenesis GTPase
MQKSSEKIENEQDGLVISSHGNTVDVEALDGHVFQCALRRNQALPVVGDEVYFKSTSLNAGTISSIKPRFSQLFREDARGGMKTIAANIHLLLIVMSPFPVFSHYLIDRYLLAAEILGISPVIILNKIDLLTSSQPALEDAMSVYHALFYPVLYVSVYESKGLDKLNNLLQAKTATLVGPSGVGKSSIIAALSNTKDSIRVGATSPKGTGKHTTTAVRLYHLTNHGKLIDSPGVREFNLWRVTERAIMQGFREFNLGSASCQFRDCRHLVEPGCQILQAVQEGKINNRRFESYQTLMKEAKKRGND